MATKIYTIEKLARQRLGELTPRFWSQDEMLSYITAGIKDLWRAISDLKGEHFITISETVTLAANTATLTGVPTDVHKIIMISPLDLSENSSNKGLHFRPAEYNSSAFQSSLGRADIDPSNDVIYYAITAQGAPVGAPVIRVAPQVSSAVTLSFAYNPTVGTLTSSSNVPIPGECDNALVAWTIAYARSKELESRAPDPSWLAIYAHEKSQLLQSLGLRQTQEPAYVEAMFEEYW